MKPKPDPRLDARLDALLRALPDKPVASNFTARVLQEAERVNAVRPARWSMAALRIYWLPRVAVIALALSSCLVTYNLRSEAHRTQFARSVAAVTQVASLPSPAMLQDFEVIRRLNQSPAADTELLALLQ